MTLREKILLAAMGAAVMGGGIQFGLSTLLPSPAPSGTDSSLQQARAVAGEVTARLQALPLSDGQRYILASSLRPAPRNPFTLPANGLPDAQRRRPRTPRASSIPAMCRPERKLSPSSAGWNTAWATRSPIPAT